MIAALGVQHLAIHFFIRRMAQQRLPSQRVEQIFKERLGDRVDGDDAFDRFLLRG